MYTSKSKLINIIINACCEVSKRVLRDFGELAFLKANKNVGEFVQRTQERSFVDFRGILEKNNHGHGFVYEGKVVKKSETGLYWLINAVDNTDNFSHRLPMFASSIALVDKYDVEDVRFDSSDILAAVIHDPLRMESFWAEKNDGAFYSSRKLRIEQKSELRIALGQNKPANSFFKHVQMRSFGSSGLHLSYLAANKVDLVFGSVENAVNFACGKLIILEAGGTIKFIGENEFVAASDALFVNLEKAKIV